MHTNTARMEKNIKNHQNIMFLVCVCVCVMYVVVVLLHLVYIPIHTCIIHNIFTIYWMALSSLHCIDGLHGFALSIACTPLLLLVAIAFRSCFASGYKTTAVFCYCFCSSIASYALGWSHFLVRFFANFVVICVIWTSGYGRIDARRCKESTFSANPRSLKTLVYFSCSAVMQGH